VAAPAASPALQKALRVAQYVRLELHEETRGLRKWKRLRQRQLDCQLGEGVLRGRTSGIRLLTRQLAYIAHPLIYDQANTKHMPDASTFNAIATWRVAEAMQQDEKVLIAAVCRVLENMSRAKDGRQPRRHVSRAQPPPTCTGVRR